MCYLPESVERRAEQVVSGYMTNNVRQPITKKGCQAGLEEVSRVAQKIAIPMLTLLLLKVCLVALEVPC
jgi:hypothetical protein